MKIERIKINNIPSIIWGEKNGSKDNMQDENIIKNFANNFNKNGFSN